MDIKKALQAYHSQRHNAKSRGIGWELTFKEWCDFWGEDIDRRGTRRDQLGMQRIMDSGPYRVGNIRKGHPRDNVRTRECAHWDAGKRIRHTVAIPRVAWGADETEDGYPDLGLKSAWDRIIA